jgi:CRP/FNR family transcriptional regulator, dissimilatory nitrate respiration regulator
METINPALTQGVPAALLALGKPRPIAAGSILFAQGEEANRLFFLLSGEVALRRLSRLGDEIELTRIQPGQWFGEVVLFAARDYPAQARVTLCGEVLEFPKRDVLSAADRAISSFFLALLSRKCLRLNRRVEELTVMPARERLLRYLAKLCPSGGPCSFILPAKKREIAAQLGIVPETLSRSFAQLAQAGLVFVRGERVDVPACERLWRALGDEE